jgi:carbohydrate-binding DOMON domain-containing protein
MIRLRITMAALALLGAWAASAQELVFKDPVGDDDGPGGYKYPTDAVYKAGSFDLTQLRVRQRGDKLDIEVAVGSDLEDPWRMGAGFSVQMVFVHVKTGEGGFNRGLPGTNVEFAAGDTWNKVVILSPQGPGRVKAEVGQKAGAMKDAVVVPTRTKGAGRTISATVDKKDVGDGDIAKWGWQVLMQSNEGFPTATDLLTRKVNEYEGQHRFGGGTDTDCDPHVMDVLAGAGAGDKSEVEEQHKMLSYECNPDGTAKKKATLKMVRK